MDDLDKLIKKQSKRIKNFNEKLSIEEKKLEIAIQIAKMRKKSGLTQKDLAKELKIKPLVISRIERGEHNITLDLLYRIARTFNKNVRLQLI